MYFDLNILGFYEITLRQSKKAICAISSGKQPLTIKLRTLIKHNLRFCKQSLFQRKYYQLKRTDRLFI